MGAQFIALGTLILVLGTQNYDLANKFYDLSILSIHTINSESALDFGDIQHETSKDS